MTTTAPNPPFPSGVQPWPPNPPQQQQQQQQQPAMEEHKQQQPATEEHKQQQAPLTPKTQAQRAPPVGPLQPLTPNTRLPKPPSPPSPSAGPSVVSPSGKRDLKSWWKSFKLQSRSQETAREKSEPRIFGVPLRQSIAYANVAISLVDENGVSYVFGYVPIVVAKCGVFLKEKATHVEGIFRLSGSEKRIKQLKTAFNTPDRYGKGLVWDGYTVHDASNVLRRYLNDLPEPVVPLAFYERFREPLRHATIPGASDSDGPQLIEGFDVEGAILQYQNLVMELPPLNRQLLLYLLDLLSVFASQADKNRMTAQNLSAIFQPGILSHPAHAMAPEEYRLNQAVLVFLIENQDYFIVVGRKAADADKHKAEAAQKDTPPVTPGLAAVQARGSSMRRSVSNASAGADSVARDGKIRRNQSTSSRHSKHSRHSRHSNANSLSNNHVGHSPSPSPAPGTPTTASPSGGLSRSNTLPARSPGLGPGRFVKRTDGSPVSPLTPLHSHRPPSAQATRSFSPVAEALSPDDVSSLDPLAAAGAATQTELTHGAGTGPVTPEKPVRQVTDKASTPPRERRFNIFLRPSANDSGELRPQPNKLKKKRGPGSANASAQSSTVSFRSSSAHDPAPPVELHVKADELHVKADGPVGGAPQQGLNGVSAIGSDDDGKSTPHVSQVPSTETTATATPTPAPDTTASTAADLVAIPVADPVADPVANPVADPATDPATRTETGAAIDTAADTATETAVDATRPGSVPHAPKKTPTSTSLNSLFNEGSSVEEARELAGIPPTEAPAPVASTPAVPVAEAPVEEQPEKEKKRRWRLSRRRDEGQSISVVTHGAGPGPGQSTSNISAVSTPPGPGSSVGSNGPAGHSTSSIGSGGPSLTGMGSTSLTGASGSTDSAFAGSYEAQAQHDYKDEAGKKKLSGWLKSKVRGSRDGADQHRTLSPSPTDQRPSFEAQENGVAATSTGEKGAQPTA